MFIPFGTTSPRQHSPVFTVGLIVIHVVSFFALRPIPDEFLLEHGVGLQPLQWILAGFVHRRFQSLLAAMAFLWIFGLIVEGMTGGRRMLIVYLATIVLANAGEQLLLRNAPAGSASCGASRGVFALAAIAFLWSPKGEVRLFYWVIIRAGTVSVSTSVFAAIFIVLRIVLSFADADAGEVHALVSAVSYCLAAVLGFAFGLLYANMGWAYLEQGHLLARLFRSLGLLRPGDDHEQVVAAQVQDSFVPGLGSSSVDEDVSFDTKPDEDLSRLLLQQYLDEGDLVAARLVNVEATQQIPDWRLTESALCSFITVGYGQMSIEELLPLLQEYIERFPEGAVPMRLMLAKVYLDLGEPRRALIELAEIPGRRLGKDRDLHDRLFEIAAARMDE